MRGQRRTSCMLAFIACCMTVEPVEATRLYDTPIYQLLREQCPPHVRHFKKDFPHRSLLENDNYPKCIARCLEISQCDTFQDCKFHHQCSPCMDVCLDPVWRDNDCALSADNPFRLQSCRFFHNSYGTKTHGGECPTKEQVTNMDRWHFGCPASSNCFYDTQCDKIYEKCCPCLTDARFCVKTNITKDERFVNFKTNVNISDGEAHISFQHKRVPGPRYVTILYQWQSASNFTDDEKWEAIRFSLSEVQIFNVPLLPGYQYQYRLGAFTSEGLIGRKLDFVGGKIVSSKRKLEVNKVAAVRMSKAQISSPKTGVRRINANITLVWPAVESLYPVYYNVTLINHCPNSLHKVLATSDNHVEFVGFPLCHSKVRVRINAAAVTYQQASQSSEVIHGESFETTLEIFAPDRGDFCQNQDAQRIDTEDMSNWKTTIPGLSLHRHELIVLSEHSGTASLRSVAKSIVYYRITVISLFCVCVHREGLHIRSYYFTLGQPVVFETNSNCGYKVYISAVSGAGPTDYCSLIGTRTLSPHPKAASSLPMLPSDFAWYNFPFNLQSPQQFQGVIRTRLFNMDSPGESQMLVLNSSSFPVKSNIFPEWQCGSTLYLLAYHVAERNAELPKCADVHTVHTPFSCHNGPVADSFLKLAASVKSVNRIMLPIMLIMNALTTP